MGTTTMGRLAWAGSTATRQDNTPGESNVPPGCSAASTASNPDFNSNISSGVINKPCSEQCAAASSSRTPTPGTGAARKRSLHGSSSSFRPFAQTPNPLTAPDRCSVNISRDNSHFQTKTCSTALRNAAEGSRRKSPFPGFPAHVHTSPALPPRRGDSGVPSAVQSHDTPLTRFEPRYTAPRDAFSGAESLIERKK